jgi:hypothetical protein
VLVAKEEMELRPRTSTQAATVALGQIAALTAPVRITAEAVAVAAMFPLAPVAQEVVAMAEATHIPPLEMAPTT